MSQVRIGARVVGPGHPVLVVAELSGNHHQDYREAVRLVHAAHRAGADAVKTQAFTPDSITLKSDAEPFRLTWNGQQRTLYDLYAETAMPMAWHGKLKAICDDLGMLYFASAFSPADVDFIDDLGVLCHKVASFELTDTPLIRHMASKGKPIMLSTGMASYAEIGMAAEAADNGLPPIILRCTSAYPAPLEDMNLATIGGLAFEWGCVPGLSDHTLGATVPIVAVALGAYVVEKHFTLSRKAGGPDAAFSVEPAELAAIVKAIRETEQVVGGVRYWHTEAEKANLRFRRSLWVVKGIRPGERITAENVRSLRPMGGMEPCDLPKVLGRRVRVNLAAGTPLTEEVLACV